VCGWAWSAPSSGGHARRRAAPPATPTLLVAGRRYTWVIVAGAVLGVIAMETALLRHDFALRYVARTAAATRRCCSPSPACGRPWKVRSCCGLWCSRGYLAVMVRHFRGRASDPLVGWATLTVFVVAAFFFALMAGPANPFRVIHGAIPTNGPGNRTRCCRTIRSWPSTRRCSNLGYVGFTIPFAFAVGGSPPRDASARGGWSRPVAGPC